VDWPAYLGDSGSSQYSSLSQINVDNVGLLELAWTYRSGDVDPENRRQIQCNPIIIDGVLYGTSPKMKLFALAAATGEELWRFDPFDDDYRLWGLGVNRGVTLWEDRTVYGAGEKIYALSKESGEEIFAIDLHVGLDERAEGLFLSSNTPGVVFENLPILGHRASENLPSVAGDIRAFDLETGDLVWSFHTIPHPGELG